MHRVRWEKRALSSLTDLWLQNESPVRKAITKATHEIDFRLRRDPTIEGESRDGVRRIAFETPLVIVFRIEPDGQTVSVLEVRLMRRRSS